jgi:tripartite-type tricarboxylate transporter receptor subunit TctC
MARYARALAAIATLATFGALAQPPSDSYPSRTVKILVPYAPGGVTDIIARHIAPKLQEVLGQAFFVENKPGASGNIALEAVAAAPPDGYTLFVGNVTTNAINENTFADKLQMKPSRALVGISRLVDTPHMVIASADFPASNIADLVAWAKKNPGKLNYASAGIGSYPHLDFLKFAKTTGIEATHIPYKGGAGQMVPSLLSNETQVAFMNLASTIEHIRVGKLKALATSMPNRLPELPNVATMTEQGYPGIGTNAWQGMFAPAATPKPIVDKLHAAVVQILNNPEMKAMLAKQLMAVNTSASPQEWTEQVRAETQAWGEFIRESRIKID